MDANRQTSTESATQRLHRFVIQPEGRKRLELLAERNSIAEGLRDARNKRSQAEMLCIRLERKLAEANAKLRGEL